MLISMLNWFDLSVHSWATYVRKELASSLRSKVTNNAEGINISMPQVLSIYNINKKSPAVMNFLMEINQILSAFMLGRSWLRVWEIG